MKQGEGHVEADTAHLFAGVFSASSVKARLKRCTSYKCGVGQALFFIAVLVIRCQTSTDPMLRNRGWPRMSRIVFCRPTCRVRYSVIIKHDRRWPSLRCRESYRSFRPCGCRWTWMKSYDLLRAAV